MLSILVDYDNVHSLTTSRGARYLTDKILAALPSSLVSRHKNASVRFYGGWFLGQTLTRRAQGLSSDLSNSFPTTFSSPGEHKIFVRAELARSLLVDPGRDLWHTYRIRQFPQKLTCALPAARGCTDQSCPLSAIAAAITSGACPTSGCTISPCDLFERNEQKLVDSMIGVDGLHISRTSDDLVIVSSDDDLWPPIHSALACGKDVHLLQTLQRTSPYGRVVRGVGANFWEGTL